MPRQDIYSNSNPKLRELKQLRMVEPLAKEVQRMAKQINQRFYRLEKRGIQQDTAYRYAQQETGKDKPRYTVNINKLEEMSIQQLYELGIQINAKLVSKTSTITGIKLINERRIQSGLKELFGDDYDELENDWKNFLEAGGGELMNNKWFDSYQIAEDWREYTASGGVSIKQFLYEYNRIKDKSNFDYGALRRRLINVRKRNTNRKK